MACGESCTYTYQSEYITSGSAVTPIPTQTVEEEVQLIPRAQAQSLDPCTSQTSDIPMCQLADRQIGDVIAQLIYFIFVIAVILALGFLVYGGIRWLTSAGNKDNVDTARGTIISAIIGLIIVFMSYVILNLVLTFLTGSGLSDLEIPSLTQPTNS